MHQPVRQHRSGRCPRAAGVRAAGHQQRLRPDAPGRRAGPADAGAVRLQQSAVHPAAVRAGTGRQARHRMQPVLRARMPARAFQLHDATDAGSRLEPTSTPDGMITMQNLPPQIFKAYDIRGIVGKTLTAEGVEAIGHALGSEAAARGQRAIAIGRDGRLSGPELIAALARGIQKNGIDVIDVGCVAPPMVYFAAYQLRTHCAVMLTGSHNPPDYNGLKMVLAGETLSGV